MQAVQVHSATWKVFWESLCKMQFPPKCAHRKGQRTEPWAPAGRQLASLTHKVSDSFVLSHQPLQLMTQVSFLAKQQMTRRALRIRLELGEFHVINRSGEVWFCCPVSLHQTTYCVCSSVVCSSSVDDLLCGVVAGWLQAQTLWPDC